jgi:quercetin dioxygenase-like cupin family protein
MVLEMDGKTTVVNPGDSVTIPHGVKHSARFPVDSRIITIVYPVGDYVAEVEP